MRVGNARQSRTGLASWRRNDFCIPRTVWNNNQCNLIFGEIDVFFICQMASTICNCVFGCVYVWPKSLFPLGQEHPSNIMMCAWTPNVYRSNGIEFKQGARFWQTSDRLIALWRNVYCSYRRNRWRYRYRSIPPNNNSKWRQIKRHYNWY